jgi:hypothetical protein
MEHLKVTGHSNLIRDNETKAIINTNSSDYNTYVMSKLTKQKENQKLEFVEKEIFNIKKEIDEIKNLLLEFLNESR